MNTVRAPGVEVIEGPAVAPSAAHSRPGRLRVFILVFVLAAIIGLGFVYARSPVYLASASVLTVKPKSVDRQSAAADLEHVAIQRTLLMGEELLAQLAARLAEDGHNDIASPLELLKMLEVVAVPATNLLELRATGEQAEQLQFVVNRWAETYDTFRLQEIAATTRITSAELLDEQKRLDEKIGDKRAEIQNFRRAHDIVSVERDENRSLSSLQGLNTSLNDARAQLVAKEARLAAVRAAVANHETVIPDSQKTEIARLKLEVQRTQGRLDDLKQRYTERYIERDPLLAQIPETLAQLRNDLKNALNLATQTAQDEAQHEVDTARLNLASLERAQSEQQSGVQTFTEHFKSFKTLEEGLSRLEQLYAENEQRLAQIQIANQDKFPPIKVVQWARIPDRAIYPDYDRDFKLALALAFGLALFVTWLQEYLTTRPAAAGATPIVGIRVYAGGHNAALSAADASPLIEQTAWAPHDLIESAGGLHNLPVLPRELAGAEVQALQQALDPLMSAYAALFLFGVSPGEIAALTPGTFAQRDNALVLAGSNSRNLPVYGAYWEKLALVKTALESGVATSPGQIDLALLDAARVQGLDDPTTINALSLWHTYVVYLVRQGIEFDALQARVGVIEPAVLAALHTFSPSSGTRSTSSVNYLYPALAA